MVGHPVPNAVQVHPHRQPTGGYRQKTTQNQYHDGKNDPFDAFMGADQWNWVLHFHVTPCGIRSTQSKTRVPNIEKLKHISNKVNPLPSPVNILWRIPKSPVMAFEVPGKTFVLESRGCHLSHNPFDHRALDKTLEF